MLIVSVLAKSYSTPFLECKEKDDPGSGNIAVVAGAVAAGALLLSGGIVAAVVIYKKIAAKKASVYVARYQQ